MTNHMWKAWFLLGAILLSGSVANAQRRASVTSSLPSGTPIVVRVNEHLSSETARAGDTFSASLAQPLVVNGRTLLSQGTAVTGRVISAQKSGRLSGPGVLELRLVSLGSANISTRSFVIKGASHTKSNVTKIGGSTVAGTVIGAIVGGEKGAAIGAGVGAGAGTAAAAATGKKPATVEAEAVLEFLIGDSPVLTSSAPIYSDREPSDRGNDSRAERFRHADDKDQDDDHDRDTDSRSWDSERYDQYRFGEHDQAVLRGCLDGYEFESLPPGIQKKLARGGTLPPGQARRLRRLPGSCTARLQPLPRDVERIIYGNRIILVAGGSRILDILIF